MTVEKVVGEQVHTTVTAGDRRITKASIKRRRFDCACPHSQRYGRYQNSHEFSGRLFGRELYRATDMEMARQLANVAGSQWGHKPG